MRVRDVALPFLLCVLAWGTDPLVSRAAGDVVISQSTTFQAGEYFFDSLTITGNSTLTLLANPAATSFKGVVIYATNITVEAGSTISANGKGYGANQGPGASLILSGGASYGGVGANNTATSAPTYGSALEPGELGSGGALPGGGAIRLIASNTLTNNGTISANGSVSGSGGSIFVQTGALAGAGSFKALGGGIYTTGYYKYPGGGGRIMVRYTSSSFTGVASVLGGCGSLSPGQICGESGTAGFIDTTTGTLLLPSTWRFQENDSPLSFQKIIVTKGSATSDPEVSVSTDQLIISERGSLSFGKDVDLTAPLVSLTGTSTLSFSGTPGVAIDDLEITESSRVTTALGESLTLSLKNASVSSGSSIDVSTKGYAPMKGPGAPAHSTSGMGASYGGRGYANTATSTYGDAENPTDFGSGGTRAGGGALALTLSGVLTNNGTISANGGFSGSGGSILVRAHEIIGSGTFSANGAGKDVSSYLGPSGGGRVALYTETATTSFVGKIEAKGACNTLYGYLLYCGEDGTTIIEETGPKVSNVLFLPGIEASRLARDSSCSEGVCSTELWEPRGDAYATQLAHDASGTSVVADIYATSIIDNAYVPIKGNIYKSFIAQMDGLVASGTLNAWKAIPYDWRLTPEQILASGALIAPGKISYLVATSSPYLIQELKRLAATSKTGKVTIIAHSNGGLITKALTLTLGADAAIYIDKIIFVAVPQVGAPQALGALLHGYGQGLPTALVSYGLSEGVARALATNMPMVYNLLPSASYFTQIDDPVATFSDQPLLADFRTRYGDLIHSQERLHTFVTDAWRASSGTSEALTYPSVGNELLLNKAEMLHATLDTWAPPEGITLYEVAGWGERTLAGIDYYQDVATHCTLASTLSGCVKTPKIAYRPRTVLDGDGTVLTPSALWTQGANRYWVDLLEYNGFFGTTKHANILEVPQLRTFIQNLLTNSDNADLPQYVSTSTPVNLHPNPKTELHFVLHSPLSLHLYDEEGRHTGVSATGELEEGIPESRYLKFGEVQFISVPSSLNSRLVMNGYAEGSFTLEVREVQGEASIASTTFAGIPSTVGTVVTADVQAGGIAGVGALAVDADNDGTTDLSIIPQINDVATIIYQWGGFLSPVSSGGKRGNSFRRGSTIPIKFQLKTFDGVPAQALVAPLWSADGGASVPYKWDAEDQQYVYTWSTKGLAAGSHTIYAKLDDGQTHSATVWLE